MVGGHAEYTAGAVRAVARGPAPQLLGSVRPWRARLVHLWAIVGWQCFSVCWIVCKSLGLLPSALVLKASYRMVRVIKGQLK